LEIQDSVEINFRYIHDQEVKSFFERADLVVLPYRKIFQSGVLIFSMSFKIPVLCSNLSSFCELVRHGENGFLFESDNVQSLANEIASIMDNQKLAHQAAERAFSMVSDELNWEKIGASVLKFYKRIDSNS
jgi:glycosyltransferase involved in cell wall biosynthesis